MKFHTDRQDVRNVSVMVGKGVYRNDWLTISGKDRYDAAHASRYEQNLVNLIKSLRKDFDAPNAPFVLGMLGQTAKDNKAGNDGLIF